MSKSKASQWGFWALRLTVGLLFVYHGWSKLANMEGTIGMFTKLGFPMASFWAWLVGLVEFFGGIAVVLGFATHIAALLLAIILVVALISVHRVMPFSAAELPLALLGATLALVFLGGGPCQVFKPKGCTGSCCKEAGACGCGDKKDGCCENKEMKK